MAFVLLIKDNINSQLMKSGIIKTVVWVLPAMWLVHEFHDTVHIGLKEMFVTGVKWWRYLCVYALLSVWGFLGGRQSGFSFSIDSDVLIIVAFVGITEEMVFRGWLLNATIMDIPEWLAVLINAILFLAIHFPRLIQEGTLANTFTSFNFLGLMALSAIFSLSFLKSKNLLIPITMHMLYDFMAFAFLP
jgi:membrane protease YdiL (CAAX protease family)